MPGPIALVVSALVCATAPFVVVLGIAQDGGYPQAGTKAHPAFDDPTLRRLVACLGVVDPATNRRWLIEATPDFPAQLHRLDVVAPHSDRPGLTGVFLTHAHIGHYTGLMHLGREVLAADKVPVYAMPRMQAFLRRNGPWDLLVRANHIALRPLFDGKAVRLGKGLSVRPFVVPHRDEYSETVGFIIRGRNRAVAFLPDIDKWGAWDRAGGSVEELVRSVDVAYLDGTFFADGEIPGRNMADIPHPFIMESVERLRTLPAAVRRRVRFIHLNRTNPAIVSGSDARRTVEERGFRIAEEGERTEL